MPTKAPMPHLEEALFHFLKRASIYLHYGPQDEPGTFNKIKHDFQIHLMTAEIDAAGLEEVILKLRNDLLAWLVIFPENHRTLLMQTLTEKYQELIRAKEMIGDQELNEWISLKTVDFTSRLIVILNWAAQLLHPKATRYRPVHFPILCTIKHEKLIKELYCPLVYRAIYQAHIIKIHSPSYDLDRAIQNTPEGLMQINKELNELKYHLALYVHEQDLLKLQLKLNREINELVEVIFESIALQRFPYAAQYISHFYSLWVETNDLKNYFPEVEAFVYSMLASCMVYTLSMQLAWICHFSQPMAFGFTLISIFAGTQMMAPMFLFANGFFSYSKQNKRCFLHRRRAYMP